MSAVLDHKKLDLKRRSDITRENYDFTLIGEEELANRRCFVLEARPLRKDKFLLRSRVWIDASDFAVIRIQGEMVMRPSFWTRKVEFTRDYHKVGDFWLPLRDASVSQLWLFGRSTLTIQYYDYVVEGRTAARNDPLPEVPAGNR